MTTARYAITFGLQGCYMPDSHDGAFEVSTRRELASLIRNELATYELPKRLFREVRINRLWSFIKRNGSSSAHFCLIHRESVLQFHGLTEEEFNQQNKDD